VSVERVYSSPSVKYCCSSYIFVSSRDSHLRIKENSI
jgi:hypothetical protein